MKNRKNTFVLAIVALILVLGVGYAVVTNSTLTINGNAAAKQDTLKVVYDGNHNPAATADCSNATNCVSAIENQDDTRAATFNIENMTYNTPVLMKFEIQNKESDLNASIATPTVTVSESEFFEATVQYGAGQIASATAGTWSAAQTLAHGDYATIFVTVRMKKTPIQEADSSTTVSVSFVASPVAGS